MRVAIVHIAVLISFVSCDEKECYSCRYSVNSGCDFKLVDNEAGLTTTTCENDCYTRLEQSRTSENTYDIRRGCSLSPVCHDTSYSVADATTIVKCCSDDKCNYDISKEIFQCYSCSDVHDDNNPDASTCRETKYKGSTHGSFETVFCTNYCEKRIRIEDGVKTVTRSCQDTCARSSSGTGVSTEIHCCRDEDICNSSSNFNASMIVVVAVSFCVIAAVMGRICCQL